MGGPHTHFGDGYILGDPLRVGRFCWNFVHNIRPSMVGCCENFIKIGPVEKKLWHFEILVYRLSRDLIFFRPFYLWLRPIFGFITYPITTKFVVGVEGTKIWGNRIFFQNRVFGGSARGHFWSTLYSKHLFLGEQVRILFHIYEGHNELTWWPKFGSSRFYGWLARGGQRSNFGRFWHFLTLNSFCPIWARIDLGA